MTRFETLDSIVLPGLLVLSLGTAPDPARRGERLLVCLRGSPGSRNDGLGGGRQVVLELAAGINWDKRCSSSVAPAGGAAPVDS